MASRREVEKIFLSSLLTRFTAVNPFFIIFTHPMSPADNASDAIIEHLEYYTTFLEEYQRATGETMSLETFLYYINNVLEVSELEKIIWLSFLFYMSCLSFTITSTFP